MNLTALGAITVDPTGLGAAANVLPRVGVGVSEFGVTADLSAVHDVATTPDLASPHNQG